MKIKFSFKNLLLASVFLLLGSLCSSEHGDAPLRSGVAAVADDGVLVRGGTSLRRASTILDFPRVLRLKNKKKKQKVPKAAKSPKGGKKAKSSQPSSQPTIDQCTVIDTQKDALLALKEGFINGDTELADWVSTTDPCDDTWFGITCSGSDVMEIDVGK
jgi:hypothetical protein